MKQKIIYLILSFVLVVKCISAQTSKFIVVYSDSSKTYKLQEYLVKYIGIPINDPSLVLV